MISILRLPCTKTSHFNHRFPYGYLVTTSYQLQHLQWPEAHCPGSEDLQKCISKLCTCSAPIMWRAVCTRLRYKFTVACWSTITSDSTFMLSSCREQSEPDDLSRVAPCCHIASHCSRQCSTCVAQPIRAMRTWRHPYLPPVCHWQSCSSAPTRSPTIRVAFVSGLNLTAHATNWRQPCSSCIPSERAETCTPMYIPRIGKVLRVISN